MIIRKQQIEKAVLLVGPLSFILGVGLAMSFLASCGKPDVKAQAIEQFQVPEFANTGNGFYLGSSSQPKSFSGSTLVWNESATSQQVAGVLKVSGDATAAHLEAYKYINDKILPRAQELDAALATRIKTENALYQNTVGQRTTAADAMFEGMLSEANSSRILGEEETTRARNVFSYYCEAKLFERAVNNVLINTNYTRRPQPSAMCETVYAKLNLISEQEPECAPNPAGTNYFACLWKHGVLKTRLFDTLYFDDLELATILRNVNIDLLRDKKNFGSVTPTTSRAFLRLIAIPIIDANGVVAPIPALKKRQTNDQIVGSRTALDLIADVESGKLTLLAPVADVKVLVNYPDGTAGYVTKPGTPDAAQKREVKFRESLKKFNELVANKAANEAWINAPFAVEIDAKFKAVDAARTAELATLMPEVTNVAADPELAAQASAATEALSVQVKSGAPLLATLSVKGEACAGKADSLSCQIQAAELAQRDYVRNLEISRALLYTQVSIPKTANPDIVRVHVRLSEDPAKKAIEACFHKDKQVQCDDGDNLIHSFQIDPKSGVITLVAKIDDANTYGLQKREQVNADTTPFFNVVDSDLTGKYIRVELAPNNLFGMLDVLTGTIAVSDKADFKNKLAVGSISLKDDSPVLKTVLDGFASRLKALSK